MSLAVFRWWIQTFHDIIILPIMCLKQTGEIGLSTDPCDHITIKFLTRKQAWSSDAAPRTKDSGMATRGSKVKQTTSKIKLSNETHIFVITDLKTWNLAWNLSMFILINISNHILIIKIINTFVFFAIFLEPRWRFVHAHARARV